MIGSGGLGLYLWAVERFCWFGSHERIRRELRVRLDAAQLIAEYRKARNQTIDLLPGRDWAYVMDDAHREAIKREREKPRRVRFLP